MPPAATPITPITKTPLPPVVTPPVVKTPVAPAPAASGIDLFNNTNSGNVSNGATGEVLFITTGPVHVTELVTYHWNNAKGAKPGTITLKQLGTANSYGPFNAQGAPGSNNVQNANWIANVNLSLGIGTYQLIDSDPSTWSQNAQTRGIGFAIIRGTRSTPAAPPQPAPVGGPGTTTPKPTTAFTPCMTNAGAIASMGPCSGGVGTKITFKLLKALKAPIKSITFKPYQVTGIPGATAAQVLVAVSGNGTAIGDFYEVTVPPQLCIGHGGTWDLFPFDTAGAGQGDIGRFGVICAAGAVPGGSGAPAPTVTPPPPGPVAAPFKPCFTNSGSVAAVSPCTPIRPGDIVTIQLSRALTAPIKLVTFKPYQVGGIPGATGAAINVTMTTSAKNAGGTYSFPLPKQICLGGNGSWDVFPTDSSLKGLGDIGRVNVVCK
jgi:hypothetical protein